MRSRIYQLTLNCSRLYLGEATPQLKSFAVNRCCKHVQALVLRCVRCLRNSYPNIARIRRTSPWWTRGPSWTIPVSSFAPKTRGPWAFLRRMHHHLAFHSVDSFLHDGSSFDAIQCIRSCWRSFTERYRWSVAEVGPDRQSSQLRCAISTEWYFRIENLQCNRVHECRSTHCVANDRCSSWGQCSSNYQWLGSINGE